MTEKVIIEVPNWVKKVPWVLLPLAVVWGLSIFHHAFDLSGYRHWYSFALCLTYMFIMGVAIGVSVVKLTDGKI